LLVPRKDLCLLPLKINSYSCIIWMSECLLFYAKWAIFQLYYCQNKLHFNEIMMMSALQYCTRSIRLVLAHINNSPQVEMSPHYLSWFSTNQSPLLLPNTACLGDK
jgi:hypothetical protein